MKTLLLLLTLAGPKYTPFVELKVLEVQVVPHDYGSKWGDAIVAGLDGTNKGYNRDAQTTCVATSNRTADCTTTPAASKDTPEPSYKEGVKTIVKFQGLTFGILNRDKKATFTPGKTYTIWTDEKHTKYYLISDEGDRWEAANETKK